MDSEIRDAVIAMNTYNDKFLEALRVFEGLDTKIKVFVFTDDVSNIDLAQKIADKHSAIINEFLVNKHLIDIKTSITNTVHVVTVVYKDLSELPGHE